MAQEKVQVKVKENVQHKAKILSEPTNGIAIFSERSVCSIIGLQDDLLVGGVPRDNKGGALALVGTAPGDELLNVLRKSAPPDADAYG